MMRNIIDDKFSCFFSLLWPHFDLSIIHKNRSTCTHFETYRTPEKCEIYIKKVEMKKKDSKTRKIYENMFEVNAVISAQLTH